MDDKSWDTMGQYKVQYHLNDTDKCDISEIYILLRYWKQSNGTLMVKVTGLYTLGDDAMKAEDLKVDFWTL